MKRAGQEKAGHRIVLLCEEDKILPNPHGTPTGKFQCYNEHQQGLLKNETGPVFLFTPVFSFFLEQDHLIVPALSELCPFLKATGFSHLYQIAGSGCFTGIENVLITLVDNEWAEAHCWP